MGRTVPIRCKISEVLFYLQMTIDPTNADYQLTSMSSSVTPISSCCVACW